LLAMIATSEDDFYSMLVLVEPTNYAIDENFFTPALNDKKILGEEKVCWGAT
jgi:hypothetical protein